MFSKLFKHKEQVILDRLLHDNHVQSPCIASFLPVNGVTERQVYIEEKESQTIQFVRIEVVPDPFITDPFLLNERKQYEGVQFCIPSQFHGLLKRCRKAISSIEEIPDARVGSIVLIEHALLLNYDADAGVYVPSKTKLTVLSLEKDHEHKPVKAVLQDIKGNTYIAKDVTPLVAYILVPTERITLKQYISGDNLKHSTVVTFDDIDENDVASNDPLEFKKLKTILAGQVRVKTVDDFDFVVAFSNNKTDHTVLLIPKENLKDIHAKLTIFASHLGKAEFICNHFQGCSYAEVIASKLYTIDPNHNIICDFSVKVPSHLYNPYVPDPTAVNRLQPRIQRFDSTPNVPSKHIDQRMSKSESDPIPEDDIYDLVQCDPFRRFKDVACFPSMSQQLMTSEIPEAYNDKNTAQVTYVNQKDDSKEESDYMPMDGTGNYLNDVESLTMVRASGVNYYVNGGVLTLERANAPIRECEDTDEEMLNDDGYVIGRVRVSTDDYEAPDDVEALKLAQGPACDYENLVGVKALIQTFDQMQRSQCNLKQHHHESSKYVDSKDEQNDEVFVTGESTCGISKHRPSIHRKKGRSYNEHTESTGNEHAESTGNNY